MHGHLAVVRRTEIEWTVAVALGRERAQALGGKQFARHHVEHTLALAAVERRVVKADGDCHARTHRGVGVRTVHIVVKVAVVVEECVDEGLLHLLGRGDVGLAALRQVGIPLQKVGGEEQSIVPERI